MSFKCELCELEFIQKCSLQRHVKTVHSSKQLKCELCDYVSQRKENLRRHHTSAHSNLKSQVIKRKAQDSDSNVNKRTNIICMMNFLILMMKMMFY